MAAGGDRRHIPVLRHQHNMPKSSCKLRERLTRHCCPPIILPDFSLRRGTSHPMMRRGCRCLDARCGHMQRVALPVAIPSRPGGRDGHDGVLGHEFSASGRCGEARRRLRRRCRSSSITAAVTASSIQHAGVSPLRPGSSAPSICPRGRGWEFGADPGTPPGGGAILGTRNRSPEAGARNPPRVAAERHGHRRAVRDAAEQFAERTSKGAAAARRCVCASPQATTI
jgi:hypothetical protein